MTKDEKRAVAVASADPMSRAFWNSYDLNHVAGRTVHLDLIGGDIQVVCLILSQAGPTLVGKQVEFR